MKRIMAAITSLAKRKTGKKDQPERKPRVPKFSVGDEVITVSPFTKEYVYTDFDGTPLYYKIEKVKWCAPDEGFRYLLEIEEEWVAEAWLQKPEHPPMVMEHEDDEDEGEDGKGKAGPVTMSFGIENGQFVLLSNEPTEKKPSEAKTSEKAELARRKEWAERSDKLLDKYNEYMQAGEFAWAEDLMERYKYEYAMFTAGSMIRELGGELGGEEPVRTETIEEETEEDQ